MVAQLDDSVTGYYPLDVIYDHLRPDCMMEDPFDWARDFIRLDSDERDTHVAEAARLHT